MNITGVPTIIDITQTNENVVQLILLILSCIGSIISGLVVVIVKKQLNKVDTDNNDTKTLIQKQTVDISNRMDIMSNIAETISQQTKSIPLSARSLTLSAMKNKTNEPITPRSDITDAPRDIVNLDHLVLNDMISHVVLKDGNKYYTM